MFVVVSWKAVGVGARPHVWASIWRPTRACNLRREKQVGRQSWPGEAVNTLARCGACLTAGAQKNQVGNINVISIHLERVSSPVGACVRVSEARERPPHARHRKQRSVMMVMSVCRLVVEGGHTGHSTRGVGCRRLAVVVARTKDLGGGLAVGDGSVCRAGRLP